MQPADARGDGPRDGNSPVEDGSGLADRDLQILSFERQWWKYAGAKEQARAIKGGGCRVLDFVGP